jgi:hypothetical protein
MNGQVEELRSEAQQATPETAEVMRQGEDVLDFAHEIAQAIEERVRQVFNE